MRRTMSILAFLLILGSAFVACYLKTDLNVDTAKYIGPQTVEALMGTFDGRYSSTSAKWATTSETPSGKKRHLEFTLADMDAKYPRDEWLQLVLNKGITVENFKDYSGYLNVRSDIILKEFHTKNDWQREDWETIKAGYIDAQIREYQLISEAKQANPEVKDWIVVDENALPNIPGVIYVQKTESTANIWHTSSTTTSEHGEIISVEGSELSEKQKLNLLNTGVAPKGWKTVYVDEDGNPIR